MRSFFSVVVFRETKCTAEPLAVRRGHSPAGRTRRALKRVRGAIPTGQCTSQPDGRQRRRGRGDSFTFNLQTSAGYCGCPGPWWLRFHLVARRRGGPYPLVLQPQFTRSTLGGPPRRRATKLNSFQPPVCGSFCINARLQTELPTPRCLRPSLGGASDSAALITLFTSYALVCGSFGVLLCDAHHGVHELHERPKERRCRVSSSGESGVFQPPNRRVERFVARKPVLRDREDGFPGRAPACAPLRGGLRPGSLRSCASTVHA